MPKRFSSNQAWLYAALKMARCGKYQDAQKVLARLSRRSLESCDLRIAAQVNRRCEKLDSALDCWREIERRGEMDAGDYYMLGGIYLQLSQPEKAAQSFEREIAHAESSGERFFFNSASIRLADLLVRMGQSSRAHSILQSLPAGTAEFVEGVGLRSKEAILRELSSTASNGLKLLDSPGP